MDDRAAAHSVARWSHESLRFPDAPSERIFERAQREQWSIGANIPGSAFALSDVPLSIRSPLAAIYAQVQYGEMIALTSAARFVDQTPTGWTKLFGATQVMDEARHVELFARIVHALGVEPRLSESIVELGKRLEAAQSCEELLVSVQIVLESYAQAMLHEGSELLKRSEQRAIRLPGSEALASVRDSIQYVAKDETRHVAFGVLCLRAALKDADVQSLCRLRLHAEQSLQLMHAVLRDLRPHLRCLGVDADELLVRVGRSTTQRLADAGLGPEALEPLGAP